jgi:SAM-dependent methyltransferase
MASTGDSLYLDLLIERGMIRGRVLELGSYNRQETDWGNSKLLIERRGFDWTGTDIEDGPGVDFTLDLLDSDAVAGISDRWDSILALNLLEHVYDPIRVLEHARQLLAPGGTIVVVGPASWQLHDFPADYWRPLPDFFIEFARRNGGEAREDDMRWIVADTRLLPISVFKRGDQKLLPAADTVTALHGRFHGGWVRLTQRLAGKRQFWAPFVELAVVMRW